MKRIDALRAKNDFPVFSVESGEFASYGRILRGFKVASLIRRAKESTEIPAAGNVYVASFAPFEDLPETGMMQRTCFGGMPVQAGYCNGRNSTFNGFEYHKTPEVNVAVSDFCLALGHSWDISDGLAYDVRMAKVFFVPRGTVLEMFGTTLHLSPLRTEEDGFRDIVILPRGTNTPLSEEERESAAAAYAAGDPEARLLLQKNKWVISHPDREPLIRQGACPGVIGPNVELRF